MFRSEYEWYMTLQEDLKTYFKHENLFEISMYNTEMIAIAYPLNQIIS